jgi:hypothetical protein
MAGDWRGILGSEHVLKGLSAVLASGGAITAAAREPTGRDAPSGKCCSASGRPR